MSEDQLKPLAHGVNKHAEKESMFGRSLGNETVTLIVGKKRKEYAVHKQLLCASSDYFKRAFEGSFKESHEGKIYLEDECEGAIEIFIGWLYRHPIPPAMNLRYLHDLFKLYVMAEKMLLDELADRVMDAILCCFSYPHIYKHLTPEIANYVWGNTKTKSPMKTFIVEALGREFYHCVGCKTSGERGEEEDDIIELIGRLRLKELWPICSNHQDFFVAFFMNFRRDYSWWAWNLIKCSPIAACRPSPDGFCRFHCHEKGHECAAIKDKIGSQDGLLDWDPEVKGDFFHDLPDERYDLKSSVELGSPLYQLVLNALD